MSLHARLRKALDGMEMTVHSYLVLYHNFETGNECFAHCDGEGP